MTFWIIVGAVVLVIVAMGYRYDRRHRRLGDLPGNSQISRTGTDNQAQAEDKSTRWNGMPYSGP